MMRETMSMVEATAEAMVEMEEVSGMAEMAEMAWVAVVVIVGMMMEAAVTEAWEAPMAEPKVWSVPSVAMASSEVAALAGWAMEGGEVGRVRLVLERMRVYGLGEWGWCCCRDSASRGDDR